MSDIECIKFYNLWVIKSRQVREEQMIPNPSDTKISRGWNPSQSQGIQGIDRHSGMPFCNSMDFVKLLVIKTVSFLPLFILY